MIDYTIYVAGADVWRPVVGYEGLYEVSGHGQVRSVPRTDSLGRPQGGVILKTYLSYGYQALKLSKDGKKRHHDVHVLVLESFKGSRPEGCQGCHRDDDRTNNRLLNLYWGTRSQNMRDAYRNGNSAPTARKTHCPQGHPYSQENTKINVRGAQTCVVCRRKQYRDHWRRKNWPGYES